MWNAYAAAIAGMDPCRYAPPNCCGGIAIADISAGMYHTCALLTNRYVRCWGYNNYGQLGTGDTNNRTTPTRVFTDIVFTSLRSSGSHTCGTSSDGETYCWGYNVEGQVGDGTRTHRTVPYRVESRPATG